MKKTLKTTQRHSDDYRMIISINLLAILTHYMIYLYFLSLMWGQRSYIIFESGGTFRLEGRVRKWIHDGRRQTYRGQIAKLLNSGKVFSLSLYWQFHGFIVMRFNWSLLCIFDFGLFLSLWSCCVFTFSLH